jgi:sugar lactone lactonase YvrE
LAGTMDRSEREVLGRLYMLSANEEVVTLLENVECSNGLAWGRDGSVLYYVDTGLGTVDAFDVVPETGALVSRRVITEIKEGSPDGMTIDEEGCLWVAIWGGYRIDRIDPQSGRTIGTIEVPTALVTSVAFGGSSRADLYITTALSDGPQNKAEPGAGGVFVAYPGVTGPPTTRFPMGLLDVSR